MTQSFYLVLSFPLIRYRRSKWESMNRSLIHTSVERTLSAFVPHGRVIYLEQRLAHKDENIHSQACYRKSVLTPGLGHKAASEQSVDILLPN